jgi:1,4-dihydroxy-2-naphthoyl-CoA synthase
VPYSKTKATDGPQRVVQRRIAMTVQLNSILGASKAQPKYPDEGQDLILRAYMSEDFREGMDAFLNKRAPNFKGK